MDPLKGKAFVDQVDQTRDTRTLVWGWGILLSFAVLFAYGKVFAAMIIQWWSDDMYSYGFLIPVISFYLIWVRRSSLRHIQPTPDYLAGSGILLLGLVMLIAGQAGGLLAMQELSLIPTIVGVVFLLLGRRFLRAIWMPIAYLLLMIPVWDIVTERLHVPFQNLSAGIGVTLLEVTGIPVHRQGLYIELPNITLEVAKACSGVNYLIAVIAIGLPMAYLFLHGWLRRSLLIGSAIVIAILANGLRVAFIGALSYYGYGGDLHGPYHILQGLLVSFIGYGALFGGVWVLSPSHSPSPVKRVQCSDAPIQPIVRQIGIHYLGSFVGLLLLLVGSYIQFYGPTPVPLKLDLRYVPFQLGEWRGRDTVPDPNVYVGVDHDLSRVYRTASGETTHLYVGYFEHQEQDKELIRFDDETKTLHRDASKVEIAFDFYGPVTINKVVRRDGLRNTLILYWYDIGGLIVTDPYIAKAYTARNSLMHRRTNGAVILVSSTFQKPEDLPEALLNSEKFIQAMFPILRRHLPQDRTS